MAHDVLISYSSRDKLQADAICNRLESRGVRCWIAPRDVGLGEYAEKIVEAIEQARIMVLVYSANADQSHQVRREVERAVSKGTTIVPVRIEDHEMSKAFELYVGSMHWLDAITPPLEAHIDRLAEQLQALLASGKAKSAAGEATAAGRAPAAAGSSSIPAVSAPATTSPVASAGAPAPSASTVPAGPLAGRGKLLAGGAAAVVAVLVLFLLLRGGESPETGAAQAPALDSVQAPDVGSGPAQEEEPGVEGAAAVDAAPPDDAPPPVEMRFVNDTAVPVLVNWIDDQGEEEHYQTVRPGREWTVDSHEGHVWVVRAAEADGELEIVECTVPAGDATCVIELVTGRDVTRVEFEDPASDAIGSYVQSGTASWQELGADGSVRFRFVEAGRDDWSVYLEDTSRGVEIQLDLWTDRILYSDATSPQRLLYVIVDAAS